MGYLDEQLITYLGNKRKLLSMIEKGLERIEEKDNIVSVADVFSGSGVVSRLFKSKGYDVFSNDLETYAYIINQCYLSNPENFDLKIWNDFYNEIMNYPLIEDGIISRLYAPQDTYNIQKDERVFYTRENAIKIDTYRTAIDEICDDQYKYFFLGPLLSEASIHTNTSGVFKGFYKDSRTKIGKFGGTKGNALSRIMGDIVLQQPVLCDKSTEWQAYQMDAIAFSKIIKTDVAYLDPPYNQHPYGSNYFMLNIIATNQEPKKISKVSGIDADWNRSDFNKRDKIFNSLNSVVNNLDAKYILLSYNSEGFLSYDTIIDMLEQYGDVEVFSSQYNTFRGCRNLKDRDIHVTEYLFLLSKK